MEKISSKDVTVFVPFSSHLSWGHEKWCLNPHYNREKAENKEDTFLWKMLWYKLWNRSRGKAHFIQIWPRAGLISRELTAALKRMWVSAMGTSSHIKKRCHNEGLEQISFEKKRGPRGHRQWDLISIHRFMRPGNMKVILKRLSLSLEKPEVINVQIFSHFRWYIHII